MRNGSNARRSRGRNNNNNNNNNNGRRNNGRPNINTVYDSNGPEGRIRGTAQQVYDKYIAQASDAAAADDQVLSQSLYQHAEHYLRVLLNDTDIDVETYRQQQMNQDQDDSSQDDDNQDDNTASSADADNDAPRQSAPPKRRNNQRYNTGDSGKDGDRMTDVPSFLAPAQEKSASQQKQKELEAEPA